MFLIVPNSYRIKFVLIKYLVLISSILLLASCQPTTKAKPIEWGDINLIINSDVSVDSVWISDIGQTESYFYPFEDTIRVSFKKPLNDLYNIGFYTETGRKTKQVWLDGEEVLIRGSFVEDIEIDTVENSVLFYEVKQYSKDYTTLIEQSADSITMDGFLLGKIHEHLKSPFSFHISNSFISRNQNDKPKISKLFDVLSQQNDTLKKHFISMHSRIESILKVDSLDITKYFFADVKDKAVAVELNPSKTYLLDFWYINCPPCINDHKLIQEELDFLDQNAVVLIGISIDRDHEKWHSFLMKRAYPWQNYREIDSLKKISKDMAIWSFPTYLHLDHKGQILGRFNSFKDFMEY